MNHNFYIGWMPSAPARLSKHLRRTAVTLLAFVLIMGTLLAIQQRQFSTASFEFGQLTSITGIYQSFPVPSVKVATAKDAFGHASYITIPLVGYGKFGAEGVIDQLQQQQAITLHNKEVTFRGTLLYSDGKTLLQIDGHDKPLLKWSTASPGAITHDSIDLGAVQLTGEVLDPKCFFGVMKPGHGKPHLDCAVRCIEGGMSPVFYVRNKDGIVNYYLILDSEGKKMNEQLKNYIGVPVNLQAKAVQYDDWVVLYVNRKTIKPTGGLSWWKLNDDVVSCGVK